MTLSLAAVGIVRRRDGRFLMFLRPQGDRLFDGWCLPGGRRLPDETEQENALREVFEESGLTPTITGQRRTRKSFSTKAQTGFEIAVFEMTVPDEDPAVVLSTEHVEHRWVTPEEAAQLPLAGLATRSIVAELRSGQVLYWPLRDCTPLLPDDPGRFAAPRKFDVHTGVDLYCERGTTVCAIEDGVVVGIEFFTGPRTNPPSPWWNETHALLVEGASGVVNYGEVSPLVQVGQQVSAGEPIAIIDKPVLRKFKGRPMVMLHIELMSPGTRETLWWYHDQGRPAALLDPTPLLVTAAGGATRVFDLAAYDGKSFTDPEAMSGSGNPLTE